MDSRRIPLNWDNYAETFPERYLQRGHFDHVVDRHLGKIQRRPCGWDNDPLEAFRDIKVLEIGGGTTGCPTVQTRRHRESRLRVWFLDPLVTRVPDWVVENLSWDEAVNGRFGFDLVIARGCINYLTPEEIQAIPGLLVPGGIFLSNTFDQIILDEMSPEAVLAHPEQLLDDQGQPRLLSIRNGSRMSPGRNGWMLQEYTHFEAPNIVHHKLVFPDGDTIEHSFFYYTRSQYEGFLDGTDLVTLIPYGKNSLLIELVRS